MAFHGNIPDEEKERLEKLWEKSDHDLLKLEELKNQDDLLREKKMTALRQRLREAGLLKDTKPHPRFIFRREFTKEELLQLDKDCADDKLSWDEIAAKYTNEKRHITVQRLKSYATREHIKTNKKQDNKNKEDSDKLKIMDERIAGLIKDGTLAKTGIAEMLQNLRKDFPDLNKKILLSRIEKLIWDKKTEEALRRVVGYGLPLDRFSKYHPYIPEEILKRKAKSLTGGQTIKHPVTFLKGLGRIGELKGLDENFELPKSSLKEPYSVEAKDADNPNFTLINGANLGLKHKRVFSENPIRGALTAAARWEEDAVVITNPFNIQIKKASGGLRVIEAFTSGLNVNLKLLESGYRNRLEGGGEIIYETTAEKFINILSGFAKITKGKPQYRGPILIVFGYIEEMVIANAAAWELGYWTRLKQEEIEVEIRTVKAALAKERSYHLIKELERLIALKARFIQSNITEEDLQKYARKVMHFVVNKIQEAVPNAKVVGKGTTFVKFGNSVVQFFITNHLQVTDTLLHSFSRSFGAIARMNQSARTSIICHPYALNYRMTAREINVGNKRAEARIFVAPIAVDGKFLRETSEDVVRSVNPISKVIKSAQFHPGILQVRFYKGVASANVVPIEALTRKKLKHSDKKIIYPGSKYIWIMVATDPHFGSRMREEVWSTAVRGSLGVSDAVIQMFRDAHLCEKGKLPVHIYTVNDDPTQGNHFGTHLQPHPRQFSYSMLERILQGCKTKDEATQLALEQARLRGADWLQEQVDQVKKRHIEPNIDFFKAILLRDQKSGLIIKGISEIHGVPFDKRDMAFINWGTGNHFLATLERVMTEGTEYAEHLKALLCQDFGGDMEKMGKLIAAPIEGNEFFAWGIIQAPGGYPWAAEFRSDPPRLSSWCDPLLAAVNNDAMRGDYGLYMTGHKTIKIYGDKHFFAAVDTEHTFYHMCASGTSTDLYGHRGFPPNNTGISFVGLPADGPDSGPILLQMLHIEQIRKYFENPYEFDWKSFLPNPL